MPKYEPKDLCFISKEGVICGAALFEPLIEAQKRCVNLEANFEENRGAEYKGGECKHYGVDRGVPFCSSRSGNTIVHTILEAAVRSTKDGWVLNEYDTMCRDDWEAE